MTYEEFLNVCAQFRIGDNIEVTYEIVDGNQNYSKTISGMYKGIRVDNPDMASIAIGMGRTTNTFCNTVISTMHRIDENNDAIIDV